MTSALHSESSDLASLVAQMINSLPAMQETQVQSLDQEDALEEEMATHSSNLPGEFHGQRKLMGYSPQRRKELDMTEGLKLSLSSIQYRGVNSKHCVSHMNSRNFPSHMAGTLFPWDRKFSFSPSSSPWKPLVWTNWETCAPLVRM